MNLNLYAAIPSLRARDCSKNEKEALNYLFLVIPLINVLIPFFWKSFSIVWSADTIAFFVMYAWKVFSHILISYWLCSYLSFILDKFTCLQLGWLQRSEWEAGLVAKVQQIYYSVNKLRFTQIVTRKFPSKLSQDLNTEVEAFVALTRLNRLVIIHLSSMREINNLCLWQFTSFFHVHKWSISRNLPWKKNRKLAEEPGCLRGLSWSMHFSSSTYLCN